VRQPYHSAFHFEHRPQHSPQTAIIIFHDFPNIEEGFSFAGYSALIQLHALKILFPDYLCAVGKKPNDTLYGHLTFALKYEGIDLAVLNALFQSIEAIDIETIIHSEPTEI